jgi:hypothetical protein
MSNLVAKTIKAQIVKCLFTAFEAGPRNPVKAADEYINFFAQEGQLRIGNADEIIGRKEIGNSITLFCQQVKSIFHNVKYIWELEGDVVLLDMDVTYCRLDNTVVTLPAMNFFRFQGDLIQELQIFMDINPVFS